MNEYGIIRPIGLDAVCSEIENICSAPYVYRLGLLKPDHMLIQLDSGSGRTTIMEYASDMFKAAGVLDFSSGLDDYVKITLDGTLPQLRQAMFDLQSAAVYKPSFTGLVEVDATALAARSGETQYNEFFGRFAEQCRHACVFFFFPSNPTKTEACFAEKVMQSFDITMRIVPDEYNCEQIVHIAEKNLHQRGIVIDQHQKVHSMLCSIVEEHNITTVREAILLSGAVLRFADFTGTAPTIRPEQLNVLAVDPAAVNRLIRRTNR